MRGFFESVGMAVALWIAIGILSFLHLRGLF